MSSHENETNATTLLGIRSRRRKVTGGDADEKPPETAWEIYNNRAIVYDKELIKDWNDGLNTLLIFAALYSAVLTAFIIESMNLLQEDTGETTRDILLTITRQLANSSIPPFEPKTFIVEAYAVRVNAYFFISISLNLIAALGSVLALQWVGSYDFGLSSSSLKARALQRHFRYVGINEWRMAEIIAVLPILLFFALFLFLIGLADWLFHVHQGLSSIVMLGVVMAGLFYATTIVISIRHTDAPFQTPVSKSLPIIINTLSVSSRRLVSLLIGRQKGSQLSAKSEYSFTDREEAAIEQKQSFDVECLLWAVNSIGITPHARDAFKILVEELVELPTQCLLNTRINGAPWLSIFTMFCRPFSHKETYSDYSEEEIMSEGVHLLARGIAMVGFDTFKRNTSTVLERFLKSLTDPENVHITVVSAYAWHALCQHTRNPPNHYFYKSLDATIQNLLISPTNFSRLSLTVLQEQQKQNPKLFRGNIFNGLQDYIGRYCDMDIGEVMTSRLIPPELLDILLRMATTDISGQVASAFDPLSGYLSAYRDAYREAEVEDRHRNALRAIRRQYTARLMQMPKDMESSNGLDATIDSIYEIVLLTSEDAHSGTKEDILAIFADINFQEKLWKLPRSVISRLFSLAYGSTSTFNHTVGRKRSNWSEWIIQISINFDKRLSEGYYGKEDSLLFMGLFCQTLNVFTHYITYDDRLTFIQNPCVLLTISTFLGFPDILFSHLSFSIELWDDPLWQETADWSCSHVRLHWLWQAFNLTYIRFARFVLAHGSRATQEKCVATFAAFAHLNSSSFLDISFELFREPTLNGFLSLPGTSVGQDRLKVLLQISLCSWFSPEFSRIGGIAWLQQEVECIQNYDLCIKLIGNLMKETIPDSELLQLTNLTKECLTRTSVAEEIRYTDQVPLYKTILHNRIEKRLYDSTLPMDLDDDWSSLKFREWNSLTVEVIAGLKRGYIDYPPRFVGDLDGICARAI